MNAARKPTDPPPQPALAWIDGELAKLQQAGLHRTLRQAAPRPGGKVLVDGREMLNLCSNDYLGLSGELDLAELARGSAAGATASRLIVGNHPAYHQLEERVAALKGAEAALVFGSGYMANSGVIPALVGRGDAVYADRLDHASIYDGIILSRAKLCRYRHNDLEHLEALLQESGAYRRKLVVTDAIFSMDGDMARLAALVELKDRYGAMLMIDEAHSGGVCGENGAGLAQALGLAARIEVQMGTFSKAYGCYGAYVSGARALIDHLVNRARSLVYSTGLPPLLVRAAGRAMDLAEKESWRRQRLHEHAANWRRGLTALGFDIGPSESQIVPLLVGRPDAAVAFASRLQEQGLAVVAIRPPTVPQGSSRLRFSLMATHDAGELTAALETIGRTAGELGLTTGAAPL